MKNRTMDKNEDNAEPLPFSKFIEYAICEIKKAMNNKLLVIAIMLVFLASLSPVSRGGKTLWIFKRNPGRAGL